MEMEKRAKTDVKSYHRNGPLIAIYCGIVHIEMVYMNHIYIVIKCSKCNKIWNFEMSQLLAVTQA